MRENGSMVLRTAWPGRVMGAPERPRLLGIVSFYPRTQRNTSPEPYWPPHRPSEFRRRDGLDRLPWNEGRRIRQYAGSLRSDPGSLPSGPAAVGETGFMDLPDT